MRFQITPGRRERSAVLWVGSTPGTETNVHRAGSTNSSCWQVRAGAGGFGERRLFFGANGVACALLEPDVEGGPNRLDRFRKIGLREGAIAHLIPQLKQGFFLSQ